MDKLAAQIENLKRQILELGSLAEEAISQVIQALMRYDTILARSVIAADQRIDLKEVEVEQHCLTILADHQPTGSDLRFVVAVLKINNDLERVGDLAANVAHTVLHLVDSERFQRVGGCDTMAGKAQAMLKDCLQALVDHDADLARNVIIADDEVDQMQRRIQRRIEQAIDRTPENVNTLMQLDFVVRQLERVGDMATNIAEDVIFMVEGKIVRHEMLRRSLPGAAPRRIL